MKRAVWYAILAGGLGVMLLSVTPSAGPTEFRKRDLPERDLHTGGGADLPDGHVLVFTDNLVPEDLARLTATPLPVPHTWVGELRPGEFDRLDRVRGEIALVATGHPITDSDGDYIVGESKGNRAIVNEFPEDCPWRWALHEVGHSYGYSHTQAGLMSYDRGCPGSWQR